MTSFETGIAVGSPARRVKLTHNRAHGNSQFGIMVFANDSKLTSNVAHDNESIGFDDISMPGANTYKDNVCTDNAGGGSQPDGLCSEVAAEPADVTE